MRFFCFCLVFIVISTISSNAQWNTNTFVNLEVAGLNTSDQQAISTSDGKTWVAFYSLNNSTGNYDMRAQLLDFNGNKLLGADGLLVSSQPSGTATFVFNVCRDIFDNLVIAFQYEIGGTLNAVVTKVNLDGSLPWGNGVVLGEGLAPYPAITKTNEVVVAWNNNSPSTTYVQKISSSGTLAWSSPTAVTVGTSNTTRAQVVSNANGDFTLVFQKRSFGISTTLYAQRYTTGGVPIWSAPIQISNLTSSGARYYSILADGNTVYFGYYVASGSRFFAYVQKITETGSLPWGINGSPVSSYSTGSDPQQQTTNIAHDNSSPYIWSVTTYSNPGQTAYGVYVQKFDTTNGTALLSPLGKEVYPISSNYDTQTGELSLVNDAPFFMSYDINYKIYATRLNSSGDFYWPSNRVELSSTTSSPGYEKGRFAFTKVISGQSVAVWYETRSGEYRSYAQNIPISGVLPVVLTTWKAEKRNNTSLLQWTSSCEINCQKYSIERSADGRYFEPIGTVQSNAVDGNCNYSQFYSFVDKTPEVSNFYRLKQWDRDGLFHLSDVLFLKFGVQTKIAASPSPAHNMVKLEFEAAASFSGNIAIYNASGKEMSKRKILAAKGNNSFVYDVAAWKAGVYYINLMNNDGTCTQGSFVKD